MARVGRRRLLVAAALVISLAGICAPGGRTVAATVARWLAHLNPSRMAAHKPTAPIPFILDAPQHKKSKPPSAKPHRSGPAAAPKKAAANALRYVPSPASLAISH